MKNPNNRDRELEHGDREIDPNVREVAESLEGFKEWQKEAKGDSLNYGDY